MLIAWVATGLWAVWNSNGSLQPMLANNRRYHNIQSGPAITDLENKVSVIARSDCASPLLKMATATGTATVTMDMVSVGRENNSNFK